MGGATDAGAEEVGVGGLELDLETVFAAELCEWGGGGTEDTGVGVFGVEGYDEALAECLGELFGGLFTGTADDEACHGCVRWVGEHLTDGKFAVGEGLVVVSNGRLDGGVVGVKRLDEDATSLLAAAGSAGYLGDEVEGSFGGAEVGEMEGRVGVDDAYEGDVGEVEPLGDHLGAEEDLDVAVFEERQGAFVGAA